MSQKICDVTDVHYDANKPEPARISNIRTEYQLEVRLTRLEQEWVYIDL